MTYPYDADELMEMVIQRHCEWLNAWTNEEEHGEGHRYTSSDFSRDSDYGWRQLEGVIGPGDGETLTMVCTISDGDEGGPTILTTWFEADLEAFYRHISTGEVKSEGWEKEAKVQVFSHLEHRGWLLRDSVREFDTERDMWLKNGELINCPGGSLQGSCGDEDCTCPMDPQNFGRMVSVEQVASITHSSDCETKNPGAILDSQLHGANPPCTCGATAR